MPHIQLPKIRLFYEEHGTGAPILLIHGTSSDADIWEHATEELAQLGRVIVYDRRGNSRSERPEPYTSTTIFEHTDDAAALLDALAAKPAIVIGRSYGGGVALDLAVRYPDYVRALVALEPGVPTLSPDADAFMEAMGERLRKAVAERGIDVAAETLLRVVLHDAGWEALPAPVKARLTANSPAILAEMNGRVSGVDPAILANITQPALVVAAASSPPAFRQIHDRLVALIPHARQAVVEGGHMITPADPRIVDFIREVLASTEQSRAQGKES